MSSEQNGRNEYELYQAKRAECANDIKEQEAHLTEKGWQKNRGGWYSPCGTMSVSFGDMSATVTVRLTPRSVHHFIEHVTGVKS